ncbi:MAG: hypothetical protein LBQ31_02125 [Bacteroidales bacterium]|nr:hypothetical protein [Bacteroidales bacterium]
MAFPRPRKLARGRAIRCKVASKRGQRTRLRGLCRARATSLRSNNLLHSDKKQKPFIKSRQAVPHPRPAKGFPLLSYSYIRHQLLIKQVTQK